MLGTKELGRSPEGRLMVGTMQRSFDRRMTGRRLGAGRRSKACSTDLIAAPLVALSSTACLAQATPEERAAGTPDVFSLCAWYVPNANKITACLVRHKGRLSSACYSVMQRRGLVP
jgi:hypothetical protein